MKQKLAGSLLGAYLLFLIICFGISLLLVPQVLRRYLYAIAEDAEYRAYLSSQAAAIQHVCYLLLIIVFLLSLFPVAVFQIKLYLPLCQIIQAASQYADGNFSTPISYKNDDELGRLADALDYLAEAANTTGEYQRKFISNISHDFRSPLTSIKGYVEAMLDGTIPPEMQERYLGIVLSETERLNKLTDGLLLLNTFDDNGVYLDMTDFDLIPVIHHTIDTFEVICGKKNLVVKTSFSSGSILVRGDITKIEQVIYNLLDNAIKFSYPYSEILISATERRKSVFVSVKDHGEGISKENLPKIWNRFYKTDASRGRDKKGTGLGLSIVREILRAHDQNINVISTLGVGTEFVFTLESAKSQRS